MSDPVADSLRHFIAQQDSTIAALHSQLGVRREHIDSLLAVPADTVVRVAEAQLADPVRVKLTTAWWSYIKDALTILLPLATYQLGRRSASEDQNRKDAKDKLARRYTAARLTRRYLLSGKSLLEDMSQSIQKYKDVGPQQGGFFSTAYVRFAIEALSDFEEIKDRLTDLDDDDLEESVWWWNLTTLTELRTLVEVLQLSDAQLLAIHGEWQNRALMFASEEMMIARQAHGAEQLAERVAKYLPPGSSAGAMPAKKTVAKPEGPTSTTT